jgi:hypothetical protein
MRPLLLSLILLNSRARASPPPPPQPPNDWLRAADPVAAFPARFSAAADGASFSLSNGLVTRTWAALAGGGGGGGGGLATTSLRLEAGDGTEFVRALAPEARVFLNGDAQIGVDVGGVLGQQQVLAWYQDETALAANPLAMVLLNFSASPVVSTPYEYAPRWGVPAAAWPPKGVHLSCDFGMPPLARGAAGFVELDGTGLACEGNEKHRLCVTGGPGCDGDSVPGECSFPRASANALCAAWPACVGVTCNASRADCQARGTVALLPGAAGFQSYLRGGGFEPTLRVTVHTQLYDGVAAFSRWLTASVGAGAGAVLSQASLELLRVPWNLRARLHAETAYMPAQGIRNSFEDGGYIPKGFPDFAGLTSPPVSMWVYDSALSGPFGSAGIGSSFQDFVTIGMNESMLDVRYPFGPNVSLAVAAAAEPAAAAAAAASAAAAAGAAAGSAAAFDTFRTHIILHEDEATDRQGLARKRMLRTVAPQVGMDLAPYYSSAGDSASIRAAADMAAAAGGFRALHTDVHLDLSPAFVAQVRSDVAYVHSKGLAAAFYVCLQHPPGLNASTAVIDPGTGEALGIACFATALHREFRANIEAFVQATGFDFIDTDCPFEHSACASTEHEHAGLLDSEVAQFEANVGWYAGLPAAANNLSLEGGGIIISCPDPYELSAGTWKQPIGYTDAWGSTKEPWTWLLLGRLYIHDGTFWKPTTNGDVCFDLNRAGNMSTPDELQYLDTGLATFLGAAGRCFQGGPLWLNDASRAIVTRWTAVFDKYRALLNGDVVHVRKPDGRGWDAMMHVLPSAAAGEPRAFAIFFNPLATRAASVNTSLCVYYANFPSGPAPVRVEWDDGEVEQATQDAAFSVRLSRSVPAHGYAWAVLS